MGKGSGEPYASVESREVSDLHFNKTIHLEAKLTGEGEDWKQDNQEINTKVHVRDGKTHNCDRGNESDQEELYSRDT